jgi:hypothetical protein
VGCVLAAFTAPWALRFPFPVLKALKPKFLAALSRPCASLGTMPQPLKLCLAIRALRGRRVRTMVRMWSPSALRAHIGPSWRTYRDLFAKAVRRFVPLLSSSGVPCSWWCFHNHIYASACVVVTTTGAQNMYVLLFLCLCPACKQGRWSKQWELRDSSQCTLCPTGTVCPIDGMSNPCSVDDFPVPFELVQFSPELQPKSRNECMILNPDDFYTDQRYQRYFWGYLDPNRRYAIDSKGRGPYMVEVGDGVPNASCWYNPSRYGSNLYQHFRDYYGRLYELQAGRKHQGYGNNTYLGYFNFGSLHIPLPLLTEFHPSRNCTSGYFNYNSTLGVDVWFPGTCEADIICNQPSKSEATSCSEGYVCGEDTNALTAQLVPCPPGFACDFGTTPDTSLYAPFGKYSFLCPAGSKCRAATSFSLRSQVNCQVVRAWKLFLPLFVSNTPLAVASS